MPDKPKDFAFSDAAEANAWSSHFLQLLDNECEGKADPAVLLEWLARQGYSMTKVNGADGARIVEITSSRGLVAQVIHMKTPYDARHAAIRSRHRSESLLRQLCSVIPRKDREAIVGDLIEDIAEQREWGWSEPRIRFHIIVQLAVALYERVKVFGKWAALGLVLAKVKAWLTS